MNETDETNPGAKPSADFQPLKGLTATMLALLGVACFHAAYTPAKSGPWSLLIIGYVVCLVQLARLKTTRQCFYSGLAIGFACFAPQLECFWRIFGAAAIALWLILAFWIGLFVALAHLALPRLGPMRTALLIPFLWTGLEYFRSELYYLRFSWLNVGFSFADLRLPPLRLFGVYGTGFVVMAYSCLFLVRPARRVLSFTILCLILLLGLPFLLFGTAKLKNLPPNLVIAGVQLEFPDEKQILQSLDKILATQENLPSRIPRSFTNVDLVVLSEYTLDAPPSERLKEWCRVNRKFLVVGGKDPVAGNDYYNTAFVISTNGEIVFKQVKAVPIQFFRDGLPAPEQKLWESPWGKIGICICYDLSYTRVTDELVRQGAQLLIVPTMDVAEWGRHQHELHARVALVRAAEYGIPIFRVASSGISQGVSPRQLQNATAPFPGEGEMIFFGPMVGRAGALPLDRWLAPLCVGVTALFVIWLVVGPIVTRRKNA